MGLVALVVMCFTARCSKHNQGPLERHANGSFFAAWLRYSQQEAVQQKFAHFARALIRAGPLVTVQHAGTFLVHSSDTGCHAFGGLLHHSGSLLAAGYKVL